eukprot:3828459-Alexandrium_andersonii.AAC.1
MVLGWQVSRQWPKHLPGRDSWVAVENSGWWVMVVASCSRSCAWPWSWRWSWRLSEVGRGPLGRTSS